MTTELFFRLIAENWEIIAFKAYEGFRRHGRGLLYLKNEQSIATFHYAIYANGKPDFRTARLINEYDPAWEVVVRYRRPNGSTLPVRIRTRPDQRHPWRIWTSRWDEKACCIE